MIDSWWLKVKRAQKHMVEIDRAARDYARTQPYKFTRMRFPDSQRMVGYRMQITDHPDPMIAVMLGDFVHNLRSALDHIIVACVPKHRRKSASFPIAFRNFRETDADGRFIIDDAEGRDRFTTAVKGLPEGALTIVIEAQPYNFRRNMHRHAIGIISRLENADKHRQLIAVGGGIKHLSIDIFIKGQRVPGTIVGFSDRRFANDGTVIGLEIPELGPDGTIIHPSEVDMEFPSGTATILIKITRIGGNEPPSDFALRTTMLLTLRRVRRTLKALEPFVKC